MNHTFDILKPMEMIHLYFLD